MCKGTWSAREHSAKPDHKAIQTQITQLDRKPTQRIDRFAGTSSARVSNRFPASREPL